MASGKKKRGRLYSLGSISHSMVKTRHLGINGYWPMKISLTNEQTNERTNEQTNEWRKEWRNKQKNELTNELNNIEITKNAEFQ